jgi:dTDP-4-dehydrorhamnose reductase
MKKVLVTGANGFLGEHLIYFLQNTFHIVATGRGASSPNFEKLSITYFECELSNESKVKDLVKNINPDIVIHTAAMSKPDACEIDKLACLQNNVFATQYLAKAAKENNCEQFIFTSTDFIFGNNGPYIETDNPTPLNFYGASKWQAEHYLQSLITEMKVCILRPVFMYGPMFENGRSSFPQWVKNNLEKQIQIKVVTDQQRTPTFVGDICAALEQIIVQQQQGVFHLAGDEVITPYAFAKKIALKNNLNANLIEPVSADTFKEIAERPINNKLQNSKAKTLLNFKPLCIDEGLVKTFV